jgi:ribulose-phosphate 3-epimerase
MAARIIPSILSADFGFLADAVRILEKKGCTLFHIDVMDGRFVPNLTFGPKLLWDLSKVSKARFDVHLMVEGPEDLAPSYEEIPAVECITVHVEATNHLQRLVSQIRSAGKKAGVTLNPATPLTTVEEVLPDADRLLIMSVNPGFGGQEYISQMTEKIRRAHELSAPYSIDVEVDGGLDKQTIPMVLEAGGEMFVIGSHIYEAKDPARAYSDLRKLVGEL